MDTDRFIPRLRYNGGAILRPEVFMRVSIRVQAPPVDFNAQEFFQPDITQMDLISEMIQESELAGLVRRFEHAGFKPERLDESVRKVRVEVSAVVEQSDTAGALSGLDHNLHGSSVKPSLALVDPGSQRLVAESAVVLLAQFHLHIQTTGP